MKSTIKLDTNLDSIPTMSSILSEAATFHSLGDTTVDIQEERVRDSEIVPLGSRSRKDSGFCDRLIIEAKGANMILEKDKRLSKSESEDCRPPELTIDDSALAPKSFASTSPRLIRRATSRRSSILERSIIAPPKPRPNRSFSSSQAQFSTSVYARPKIRLRSSSAAYARPDYINPFLIHQKKGRVFGSLEGTLTDFESPFIERNSPALAGIPAPSLSELDTESSSLYTEKAEAISNHVPRTIIDWTSPSTRRREYEEIDKSCRGVRGLWRRFAPRWCRANSRLKFYDGADNSDVGSVRRYRLDLVEHDDEKIPDDRSGVGGNPPRPVLARCKSSWGYFRAASKNGRSRGERG